MSFLIAFLQVPWTMSFGNKDIFTSSFPIWIPFISTPCPTVLTRASSTIEWSGDRGPLGKSGQPFAGHVMLAKCPLSGRGSPLYPQLAESLNQKWVSDFIKFFFLQFIDSIIGVFYFDLLIILIDVSDVQLTLYSWDKVYLVHKYMLVNLIF